MATTRPLAQYLIPTQMFIMLDDADGGDECNHVPDVYSQPKLPIGVEMIIADNHTSFRG